MELIQGPRLKSEATKEIENLVKALLKHYQQTDNIQISYNSWNELVIVVNQEIWNLTQLLKHQPDFSQLSFSKEDIDCYDAILRSPGAFIKHVERDKSLTAENLRHMEETFPHLSHAEFSVIRAYTECFWAPIYYLMEFAGQQPFPTTDELHKNKRFLYGNMLATLVEFYKKLILNGFDHNQINFEFNDPTILKAVIKETLIITCLAASALSKEMQTEMHVVTAASEKFLDDNINTMKGIGLALIPENLPDEMTDCDDFVLIEKDSDVIYFYIQIIAYGKNINKLPQRINLNELLDNETFSEAEKLEIFSIFSSQLKFNSFENIASLTRTKLINSLLGIENVSNSLYEKIYHIEEEPEHFNKVYLEDIIQKTGAHRCFQFIKSFCSTSTSAMDMFKSGGLNIVTTYTNPIGFIKNIEAISTQPNEAERLLVPGQQILYTRIECSDYTDRYDKEIRLQAIPFRSLDDINPNSYSHALCLTREKLISLTDALAKISFLNPDNNALFQWLRNMIVLATDTTKKHLSLEQFHQTLTEQLTTTYLKILTASQSSTTLHFFRQVELSPTTSPHLSAAS